MGCCGGGNKSIKIKNDSAVLKDKRFVDLLKKVSEYLNTDNNIEMIKGRAVYCFQCERNNKKFCEASGRYIPKLIANKYESCILENW